MWRKPSAFAIVVVTKLIFRKLDPRCWSKVCKYLHVENQSCTMFETTLRCFPSNNFLQVVNKFAIVVVTKLIFRKLDPRCWSKVCKYLHVENQFCTMFEKTLRCFPSNNFLQVVKKNLFWKWSFLLNASIIVTYIFIIYFHCSYVYNYYKRSTRWAKEWWSNFCIVMWVQSCN